MTRAARTVDRAIGWYQGHVSPRKGWSCAHRVAHGGTSCSQEVRSLVRRRGLGGAAVPTALRFVACYQAAMLMTEVQGVCCCGGIPVPFRFGGR